MVGMLAGTAVAASLRAQGASTQPSAPAGAQRMAYVNTQQIFEAVPGRADAQAQFEKEMTATRGTVQKLQDSLQTLQAAYAKEEATLTPAQRDTRQKSLREKAQSYQERVQGLDEQMQQRQQELMAPLMDQVRLALDDVRQELGYAFVFDISAGQMIVSADKNLDITERVVAKIRTMPKPTLPIAGTSTPTRPAAGPSATPAGVARPKPPTR
ncbi:MAG: OmpH family outer membrane protein [Gemmatimonadaceae bacterium]|nr:OmpH family outer membrane protein [Gemmatimonadaceae bacterium]